MPDFKPQFLQIPMQVFDTEGIKPLDTQVYGAIACYEQLSGGKCIASNETIAKMLHASTGGVSNALSHLAKLNLVEIVMEKGKRKSIKTLVRYEKINRKSGQSNGVPQPKVVNQTVASGQSNDGHITNNYNNIVIPDGITKEVEAFKQHRKLIKKPMTDYAVTCFVARVQKLAPGDESKQRELIDMALVSGWQTVYLPKDEPGKRVFA
jgi:hypothetical protein